MESSCYESNILRQCSSFDETESQESYIFKQDSLKHLTSVQ